MQEHFYLCMVHGCGTCRGLVATSVLPLASWDWPYRPVGRASIPASSRVQACGGRRATECLFGSPRTRVPRFVTALPVVCTAPVCRCDAFFRCVFSAPSCSLLRSGSPLLRQASRGGLASSPRPRGTAANPIDRVCSSRCFQSCRRRRRGPQRLTRQVPPSSASGLSLHTHQP